VQQRVGRDGQPREDYPLTVVAAARGTGRGMARRRLRRVRDPVRRVGTLTVMTARVAHLRALTRLGTRPNYGGQVTEVPEPGERNMNDALPAGDEKRSSRAPGGEPLPAATRRDLTPARQRAPTRGQGR